MSEMSEQGGSITMVYDNLPAIPNTTNVIVDISCQSLCIASPIHEYTILSLADDSLLYLVKFQV